MGFLSVSRGQALDYAAVDLWQLGAVAFYVLTGHHAFASRQGPRGVTVGDNGKRG